MSWGNFQEDAFNLTEAEVKILTRRAISEYNVAKKSINKQLQKVYADILSGVAPEDYYNTIIKRDRLENLLKTVRADYASAVSSSNTYVRNAISLSFSNTYYRKAYATEWLVENAKLGILPRSLVELTTTGTNKAWNEITKSIEKKFGKKRDYLPQRGTLSSLLATNSQKEINQIQSALIQNLVNGQSKTQTIKSIADIIGKESIKNGVLTVTGAKANATRIIRTETNRTMNMGSYAQTKYADDQGIEIERQLQAVLDTRTRAQSASMDGQRRGVDEPFTYPDGKRAMTPGTTGNPAYDVNDRETVIDIIDGESPEIRRGRNPVTGKNEVFTYKNFDQWAKDNDLTRNKYGQIVG